MTTTIAKLTCPDCRRENEAERIYCHDCGARLDRTAVVKAKEKEEDPKVTQKRVRAMFDARRAKARRNFFNFSKLLLGALAVASVIQMMRPPDQKAVKSSPDSFPPQISLDLSNAETDPRVSLLRYSDDQVNAYLASSLRSKRSRLSQYLQFDQLFVHFDENRCRATVQRSLYGVPLSTSALFVPDVHGNTLSAKMVGGSIGRLPVHPWLMQFGNFLFADVRSVLEREQKSIVRLGSLQLHPETIVIGRRPPQA